jgi:2-iminobutanoate/2-iminopropanoate deaminase
MKPVHTEGAPAAIGPYSQAVRAGDLLFCSGQICLTPEGELLSGSVEEETQLVLKNLRAVLEAGGASMGSVIKTTVFLASMDDFPAVNGVYAQAFGDHRPARACVEVSKLPKGVKVEIDAIAQVTG